MNSVFIKSWVDQGSVVKLLYTDGDVLLIRKSDFDRAFGPIISGSKDQIRRDFAITE